MNVKNKVFLFFCLTTAFEKMKALRDMRTKRRVKRNRQARGVYCVSREELAAIELLKSTGAPLLEAAQVACAALRFAQGEVMRAMKCIELGAAEAEKRERTVSLCTAAWASVEARKELRPTTRRDLRHFVRRILRVEGAAEMPLRAMTTADCKRILTTAFGNSPSSFKKGRVILSSVFSFGIRQEWADSNPVKRIEPPTVQEKLIEPLLPAEVERLKEAAERPEFRDMRVPLRLMLYGGIRPTEVSRLKDDDINWEDRLVIVRPRSSKTGGGRAVPLRGMSGIRNKGCCMPRNWTRRWRALRRAAGFRHWVPDVCRHTFATYYAAMFRNLPELQLEMGHRDVSLLRSRYMVPTGRKEAEQFWQGCK